MSLSESGLGTRMTKKFVNFFADNPLFTRQMLAVPVVSFIPHAQIITNSYATPVQHFMTGITPFVYAYR
jgi:hypothetical protein